VNRRSFVVAITGTALIACRPRTRTTAIDELTEHELATVAAIADTLFPPGAGPSARDAGALAVILDPAYGVRPYLPRVVADVDDWTGITRGLRRFVDLSPETRELVLEQRMGLRGGVITSWYRPVYEAILALCKLALYGGVVNQLGTGAIGFPGPSAGYAPGSAAGAYTARDLPRALATGTSSTIEVAGAGAVTSARIRLLAASDPAVRATVRATVRIRVPGGRSHDLALRGTQLDASVPVLGPAAGAWRLDVVAHAGAAARLALWSLVVRTDLDDAG
jgi:hypothetical protein